MGVCGISGQEDAAHPPPLGNANVVAVAWHPREH
jgi:hypothetical protein